MEKNLTMWLLGVKNDLMAHQSIAYLHVWTFPISGQNTGRNSTLIEKEVHAESWNSDVLLLSRFSEPWKGLVFPSKMGPKITSARSIILIQISLEPAIAASPKLMSSGCAEITHTHTHHTHTMVIITNGWEAWKHTQKF